MGEPDPMHRGVGGRGYLEPGALEGDVAHRRHAPRAPHGPDRAGGPPTTRRDGTVASDSDLFDRIEHLVAEEQQLRAERSHGRAGDDAQRDRLAALEVELDRCWDLLRQRRALHAAGRDASEAAPRAGEQVENYLS